MPSTYNGIGTHYYGKKNVEVRHGECRSCGNNVALTSYDTRLWFVILFIPVIPLGKKRIIEYCPSCTRHYAMELGKWETAKQLEISGAFEKFRANPTPESAIEVHQQLLQFHQTAQAAEFRQTMAEKFPDNARVHAHLGAAYAHLGYGTDAIRHFARAVELRSDMPEARIGLANQYVRDKRLDDARHLLDFLEKPGAGQLYSLEPLETLAIAYQLANNHEPALELLGKILEAYPKLAEHQGFRKLIKKSEKALKRKTSLLPKNKFSWKRLFTFDRSHVGESGITWRGVATVGVIIAVVLLALVISNEYIRRHRKIYVVSGYATPATVEVEGGGKVTVGRSQVEMILPEGRHRAKISGPIQQTVDFDVREQYLSRWSSDAAWVLNVGGSALVVYQEAVYSKNPGPGSISFHFGQPFQHFADVTHPFTPLPATLSMKSHETRTLRHLEVESREPAGAFYYLLGRGAKGPALQLAEWRLRLHPEDDVMLVAYSQTAASQADQEHVAAFLRAGLTNLPVAVEWHRAYQNLSENRTRDKELLLMYDGMLAKDPANSDLLYLRGRVAPTVAEGASFFERARVADPKNAYAHFALGWDRIANGDWAEARPLLATAVELRPKAGYSHWLWTARLALKEFGPLEEDLRKAIAGRSADVAALTALCDLCVITSRPGEAEKIITELGRTARGDRDVAELVQFLRRRLMYATGDFATLEKDARNDKHEQSSEALFQALVEQGKLFEATKVRSFDDGKKRDAYEMLAYSLAWRLASNQQAAAQFHAKAVSRLEGGSYDDLRAAALLTRKEPPTPDELKGIVLQMDRKALLLAVLARLHPAVGAQLAAGARAINVTFDYPHHLIERALADIR